MDSFREDVLTLRHTFARKWACRQVVSDSWSPKTQPCLPATQKNKVIGKVVSRKAEEEKNPHDLSNTSAAFTLCQVCSADKGPSSQSCGFSTSHVRMWDLDCKESWAQKNWCFGTVVLEKTLQSPLNCKEIKPVNPKGNQPWIFIGRTNAEAETPILWPPDVKNWLTGKDPDAGKDWRQEEKGTTEDEMIGWHHQLDGHEFEQAPRVCNRQGSLLCCSPWGRKKSDSAERLNCTELRSKCFMNTINLWDRYCYMH